MTEQGIKDLGLQATNGGGCACCSPTQSAAPTEAGTPTAAESAQFFVTGMTCSHCVSSVTEEISAIAGVSEVSVDLHAGGVSTVTVSSGAPVDAEQVRAAVEEAGYSLAPAS
ncbi:heavy-metal-associated domain-containing protein [Microbacterium xylanilyticum]